MMNPRTKLRPRCLAASMHAGLALGRRRPVGAFALILAITACNGASQSPAPTAVLGDAIKLAPAGQRDVPGSLVYRAPDLDTRQPPTCFYVPDTVIDTGSEAVFVDVTDQQKQIVADEVTTAFRHAIGQHQRVTSAAAPNCAKLQLYLTGVTKSTPPPVGEAGYSLLMGGLGVGPNPAVYGAITVAGKFVAPDGTALAGFVNTVGTNSFAIPPNATPRQIAMLTAQRLANEIASEVDQEVAVQKSNQKR